MFESMDQLLLGLLTGFAFGFLLQKGQVAKYDAILGQLLLKDWTVFKVMMTAIVVGSIGVYALVSQGAAHLDIWPFQAGAMLLGAALFGVGIAIFGYCPGTGLAGSGEGSHDAMAGVLGMITGAGVFVACYNWLEPIMLSLGDYGKITIPLLLDVPPWLVIGLLVVVAALVFGIIERVGRNPSINSESELLGVWPIGGSQHSTHGGS